MSGLVLTLVEWARAACFDGQREEAAIDWGLDLSYVRVALVIGKSASV